MLDGIFNAVGNIAGSQIANANNYNISQENLAFQRENLNYEKALQKQIFEREDTAYQRTVNDMRMAGLNPISMQGTNSAGEAIQTEPLHNDYQAQKLFDGTFNLVSEFLANKNNTTLANAQANLINAQADNQKIKNQYEEDMLLNALYGIKADNIGKDFENNIKNIRWLNDQRNFNFNEQFGLSDNMPDYMKLINVLTHQGTGKDNSNLSILHNSNPNVYDYYTNMNSNKNIVPFKFNSLGSILDDTQLKGAMMENKLGQMLLKILGMGK